MPLIDQEERLQKRVHNLLGRRDALQKNADRLSEDIKSFDRREEILDESLALLNIAAELSRKDIKATIEVVITRTIQKIMEDDNYNFEIIFEKKRGQIEARAIITPPGGNILDSKGGTILDIITTTMRIIIKELLGIPGFVAMDEPAKNIADAHQSNFFGMLKSFSRKTGTQIIMCSHNKEYIREADAAIEVRLIDGRSTARVT